MLSLLYAIAEPVSVKVKERTREKVYLHLVSELGELAEELNIRAGELYKEAGPDGVMGEAADCMNCLCDLVWNSPIADKKRFIALVDSKIKMTGTPSPEVAKRQFLDGLGPALTALRPLTHETPLPPEVVADEMAALLSKLINVITCTQPIDSTFWTAYETKCLKWLEKAA